MFYIQLKRTFILCILVTAILIAVVDAASTSRSKASPIEYQGLKSASNPDHSVRFVTPQFCDPNVTQYSGYLDIGSGNKYFFWFFESRHKPEKKPLTVWLNGGPGCSSMIGLWQETGPCRSSKNGTDIEFNRYTWTHHSNMLFIDQPSGVGYSYGDTLASNVPDSAHTFYDAIQLFYEAFPKCSELPLHIFGESFAGRYIPLYAEHIVRRNLKILASIQSNSTTHEKFQRIIPIESVGIGNGWINPLIQLKYSSQMACESNYGQLLPQDLCQKMKTNYGTCSKLVENCYRTNRRTACVSAERYCSQNIDGLFERSGRNYYDVRQGSHVVTPPEDYIQVLNNPTFQRAIGVESIKFEQCADKPYAAMSLAGQGMKDSSPSLEYLLNNDIRVLSYVGDADYLCNWYGLYALSTSLNFNGSDHFNNQTLKPWVYRKREVGQIKSNGQLTFLRIYGAGHEVPYYQPLNALAMFYKWFTGKKFHNK